MPGRSDDVLEALPASPGVYAWWVPDDEDFRLAMGMTPAGAAYPLYVGVARKALSRRVPEHLARSGRTEFRWALLEWLWARDLAVWSDELLLERPRDRTLLAAHADDEVEKVMRNLELSFAPSSSEDEARTLERSAIKALDPLFNIAGVSRRRHRDGDSWIGERFSSDALDAYFDWDDAVARAGWAHKWLPAVGEDPNLALDVRWDEAGASIETTVVVADAPVAEGFARVVPSELDTSDAALRYWFIDPFCGADGRSRITGSPLPDRHEVLASWSEHERRVLAVVALPWDRNPWLEATEEWFSPEASN